MATDLDSALSAMISAYGVMSAGALLSGEHRDATYNLSELASMSMTEWAPELLADTEYYFFVYPFNAKDEMELYQHEFVAENLRTYGTFATAPLVAGEFETGAAFEVVSHDEKAIEVNVTFAEDVKTVIYAWYSSAFLDGEEAAADLLDPYKWDAYSATIDAENPVLNVYKESYYGIDNPITLVMLAINADGQYVLIQQEFKYEAPAPETYELASVVATYQENDTNWYALTMTDTEGNVITTTAGNGGVNYLNAGTWDFSNYYSSGFALGNPFYNGEYTGAMTMEVAHVDGQYNITVTIPQGIYTYVGAIEGFIIPEPVVLPNCENLTFQLCQADGFISASFSGYGDIRLVDAEGKNYINIEVNDQALYTHSYVYDGGDSYDAGTIYSPCTYVRYDGPGYDGDGLTPSVASGTMEVVANGNDSTITIDFVLEDGNKFSGVYTGALPF